MKDIERLRFSVPDQKERKFLNGNQALVLAPMVQRARDRANGLNTAGYVSGYPGSPVATLINYFSKADRIGALKESNVTFRMGLNEELAVDAVWGTQQASFFKGARYDGVFGMWFGKGPGLDRSLDAIKHAHLAGVHPHGGVIAVAGDDHACKSSTTAHQSEQGFIHAGMPVLAPSSVQEVLNFALCGFEMSRCAAGWVGFKVVTDVCEASATIDVDPHMQFDIPPLPYSSENLHIKLSDKPLDQELAKWKRLERAKVFADANGINALTHDAGYARLALVASGHAYAETLEALRLLGIDERKRQDMHIVVFRVGMPWPLSMVGSGLDTLIGRARRVLVIEEKEPIVEDQIKKALYGRYYQPPISGKMDAYGKVLLPNTGVLSAAQIAAAIAQTYCIDWHNHEEIKTRAEELTALDRVAHAPSQLERVPFYCSGCPHNTSTKVPEGTKALAGIGCHYMAQWMPDRPTVLVTQMGGEGAPAFGSLPFVCEKSVFVNMGDGTYFHSGSLAIREAIAWSANYPDKGIVYKILFNDAIAMTGGQKINGVLTVPRITWQMYGEGVSRIVIVAENPHAYAQSELAPNAKVYPRSDMDAVMDELIKESGVSILIYDQTCAAEKRRRRKSGTMPDPTTRVVINERVCEGCGDCSKQSNCLSIEPVDTPFGQKRRINQSSCNKDYSCVKGFCPSFVFLDGAELDSRTELVKEMGRWPLPEPAFTEVQAPHNILLMGIGGTGVMTAEQIISTAAHLSGMKASGLSITGLSQKYGAVSSHVRIAPGDQAIHSPRIPWGEADVLLGCDMIASTSAESMAMQKRGRTHAIVNVDDTPTAEFIHNRNARLPKIEMRTKISNTLGDTHAHFVEAASYVTELFGDSIATNLFLLGYAYQLGVIPIKSDAIREAIYLNGVEAEENLAAFTCGRFACAHPIVMQSFSWKWKHAIAERTAPRLRSERIKRFTHELVQYQDALYATRYSTLVAQVAQTQHAADDAPAPLLDAVIANYFKLLAYKDEYEVARLYSNGEFEKQLDHAFGGKKGKRSIMLAPPLFSKKDTRTGLPVKGEYGSWIFTAMRLLSKGKRVRGTWADPFGYTRERIEERELITWYEELVDEVLKGINTKCYDTAVLLLRIPEDIRGYGYVKHESVKKAKAKAELLLKRFREKVPH
ncbi:MAG: indolepyruvate ferredoxin oxidoreductase family protein [Parcubacteria group bacterium]|nr:indolepyruvate ferredoxin oxidoreductase family protein [Parcubacteria group bacterium]